MKKLYHELNLKQVYKNFEEESYKDIVELISQKSANLPEGLFLEFVKKIYKRDKWAALTQTRVSVIASPRDEGFELVYKNGNKNKVKILKFLWKS